MVALWNHLVLPMLAYNSYYLSMVLSNLSELTNIAKKHYCQLILLGTNIFFFAMTFCDNITSPYIFYMLHNIGQ